MLNITLSMKEISFLTMYWRLLFSGSSVHICQNYENNYFKTQSEREAESSQSVSPETQVTFTRGMNRITCRYARKSLSNFDVLQNFVIEAFLI